MKGEEQCIGHIVDGKLSHFIIHLQINKYTPTAIESSIKTHNSLNPN